MMLIGADKTAAKPDEVDAQRGNHERVSQHHTDPPTMDMAHLLLHITDTHSTMIV